MVYMIGFDEIPLIKIGTSNNIEERFRQINTCTPFVPRLLATTYGGREEEKELHESLRAYHYYKEFYHIPPNVLLAIVEEYDQEWQQTNWVDVYIAKFEQEQFIYNVNLDEP